MTRRDPKPWWASKTLIVNGVAIATLIAARFGLEITEAMQADVVGVVMAAANIALRLVTGAPIKRPKVKRP